MPDKKQSILALSQTALSNITSDIGPWLSFLESAGRHYAYPFGEQVLIYTQRPDATACAPLEVWNRQYNRNVRTGAKSIALLRERNGNQSIGFVFDVSDTVPTRSAYPFRQWKLEDIEREALFSDMESSSFAERVQQRAYDAIDSSLKDEDAAGLYDLAATSAAYAVLSRCGSTTPFFRMQDFFDLSDIHDRGLGYRLGCAVSTAASRILREIEECTRDGTLAKLVLARQNEDKDAAQEPAAKEGKENEYPVQTGERSVLPRPGDTDGRQNAAGPVRAGAAELPERAETGAVHRTADDRQAASAPLGDGTAGMGDDRRRDEADGAEPRGRDTGQGQRPAGLDGMDEQRQEPDRGTGAARTGVHQLEENVPPGEVPPAQGKPQQGGSDKTLPPLSMPEVFDLLRCDESMQKKKPDIVDFYLQNPEPEARADYLRNAYNIHFTGVSINEQIYGYHREETGLNFWKGNYLTRSAETTLTWLEASVHIRNLIDTHQYLTDPQGLLRVNNAKPEQAKVQIRKAVVFSPEDIEFALCQGSGYKDGKFRIYEHFENTKSTADNARFLREEYGTGGGSITYPSGNRGFLNYEGKGVELTRHAGTSSLDEAQTFSWNQAAKYVRQYIQMGRYFDDEGLGVYREWKADKERRRQVREQVWLDLPDSERRIEYQIGDILYLGGKGYTVEAIESANVLLRDADFPLVSQNLPAQEVERLALANSRNAPHIVGGEDKNSALAERMPDWVAGCYPDLDSHLSAGSDLEAPEVREEMDGLIDRHIEKEYPDYMPLPKAYKADPDFRRKFRDNVSRALGLYRQLKVQDGAEQGASRLEFTVKQGASGQEFIMETDDSIPDETLGKIEQTLEAPDPEELARLDTQPAFQEPQTEQPDFFSGGYIQYSFAQDEPPAPAEPQRETEPISTAESFEPEQQAARDFVITDDRLGEGGDVQRYNWNLAAIEFLKILEEQNVNGNPEQQEILSRYVGWGSLPQAFDPQNTKWNERYERLKALLDENEYRQARASTLNAHYTAPIVIKEMYRVLERMGFDRGNLCDPGCGVGNFLGLMPESMKNVRKCGVEVDSITGRIAQQLYPGATIFVSGFEDVKFTDAAFDVMVGNVPFGSYGVQDGRYDKYKFSIHDYFFAKALDAVRPGGIIAFITSKFTMDKKDKAVRQYIANRADLLGAVRLPNTAFKANAGTEVTTDILFLQRLDRVTDRDVPWIHLAKTEDGIPVNSYYIKHPEMMLGTMAWDDRMYGGETETTCNPHTDTPFPEQLARACDAITGAYLPAEKEQEGLEDGENAKCIPADLNVRNFSYTLVNDQLYFRENSIMYPVEKNKTAQKRIRGMITLRDCMRDIIQLQLVDAPDQKIRNYQVKLNELYDAYTKKYGIINSRGNSMAFKEDTGYYLLCSLEVLDDEGNLKCKSDMFSKRTVRKRIEVHHADTVQEALAISIGERAKVDLIYMQSLLSAEKSIEEITAELQNVIYHDPGYDKEDLDGWKMADEYLSGDVRQKLALAQQVSQRDPDYRINVQALEQVQPKELDATEIGVRVGARWIPVEVYQQFMQETFEPSSWARDNIRLLYIEYNDEYNIRNKSHDTGNVKVNSTYGTKRKNAYQILEDCLNLRATRVYDTVTDADGNKKQVFNKKETILAQAKQETVKQAFKDWVFKDVERRQTLVKQYNTIFNSERAREYNGEHIQFVGMNPEKKLEPHQVNAVARGLYGGNTLLAHVVGAGKTYEMVALAMELKRLGLCNKSLIVVPNHLIEQWAGEFFDLYPSANILVSTNQDFETANRKKFCGRISTGDWDAIIIGHSQFEKIPVSQARQIALLNQQIDDIVFDIAKMKADKAENFTIKQAERTRKSLLGRLKRLNNEDRKDDVITFEELGVDRLFVDESHFYKNLFMYTKMRNVAGIPQSEAQKSNDLFLKCQYLDEVTGCRGVIFATGTPISNSMVELYTIMRYLQSAMLAQKRMAFFDAWASNFGETVTALELAPEGGGYRLKTRFARFYNLPELMILFREVADIQTADMLQLKVPELEGGKPIDVVVKPSVFQREQVALFGERADMVRKGDIDPREDNMLKITNDGRKLALDQRLFDPSAPDDPGSKINACVERIYREWKNSAATKGTQLVFCDQSTPKENPDLIMEERNGVMEVVGFDFSAYRDVKEKLVKLGIPEHEVAFIHDAKTDVQKATLFSKVKAGRVRVLIGSTQKMGAGTNVQKRMVALHHLDVPWRPSDIEQREGRLLRQGNDNAVVRIYRYVTEGTFDAYSWGLIESKQKFTSQIMTSKSPARFCEDVDDSVLTYAEIKALATGNPKMKEKSDLEIEISRLQTLKAGHDSEIYGHQDALISYFPKRESEFKARLDNLKKDIEKLAANPLPEEGFAMEVNGVQYTERKAAGEALLAQRARLKDTEEAISAGYYRGFPLKLSLNTGWINVYLELKICGSLEYTVPLEDDPVGNTMRISNELNALGKDQKETKESLDNLYVQWKNAREEADKPFPQQEKLSQKLHRLAELNAELTIGEQQPTEVVMEGDEPEDEDLLSDDEPEREEKDDGRER